MSAVLAPNRADPALHLSGNEFRAIVGPYELRRATQDKQVRQGVDYVGGIELANYTDHQRLLREFIDDVKYAEEPPVMCPVLSEIRGPDVVRVLRPETDARSVVQPGRPFFACFYGTFSPSRRHIRSTRL